MGSSPWVSVRKLFPWESEFVFVLWRSENLWHLRNDENTHTLLSHSHWGAVWLQSSPPKCPWAKYCTLTCPYSVAHRGTVWMWTHRNSLTPPPSNSCPRPHISLTHTQKLTHPPPPPKQPPDHTLPLHTLRNSLTPPHTITQTPPHMLYFLLFSFFHQYKYNLLNSSSQWHQPPISVPCSIRGLLHVSILLWLVSTHWSSISVVIVRNL